MTSVTIAANLVLYVLDVLFLYGYNLRGWLAATYVLLFHSVPLKAKPRKTIRDGVTA